MTDVDPTRLSVSEDGRTVMLDGDEMLLERESGGWWELTSWITTESGPYIQYILSAIAANGWKDASYLRPDCPHPFVGRVMTAGGEERPGRVLDVDSQGICAVQIGADRPFQIHSGWLRPLPPPVTRRPMTPAEFVAVLDAVGDWVVIDGKGEEWMVQTIRKTGVFMSRRRANEWMATFVRRTSPRRRVRLGSVPTLQRLLRETLAPEPSEEE